LAVETGLEIDHQLELGGGFHGKVGRSGASQDSIDVGGGALKQIAAISAIRDEAAGIHELSEPVNGGQSAHRREVHEASSVGDGEVIVHR
jgi:hypothetical protein